MKRYEIFYDDGRAQFYLVESSGNNRGILLSDDRKARYDTVMKEYKKWQIFLERKRQ